MRASDSGARFGDDRTVPPPTRLGEAKTPGTAGCTWSQRRPQDHITRSPQPVAAKGAARGCARGQPTTRKGAALAKTRRPDTEGRHAGGATTCRSLNNYRPAVHVAREATTPHLGTHTDVLLKVFKGLLQTSARATSRHPVTATARQQRQQGARAGHHESHILATQLPDDQGRL